MVLGHSKLLKVGRDLFLLGQGKLENPTLYVYSDWRTKVQGLNDQLLRVTSWLGFLFLFMRNQVLLPD
jgi:hypothetical protein